MTVSQYPVPTSRNEVTFWTVQVEGSRLWSLDLEVGFPEDNINYSDNLYFSAYLQHQEAWVYV